MEFSRQEYWSRLPFPTLGDLPDWGTEPMSHISCICRQVLYQGTIWEALKPCGAYQRGVGNWASALEEHTALPASTHNVEAEVEAARGTGQPAKT